MQIIFLFDIDNFDSNKFIGFVIFAFVDMRTIAEADLIWEGVGEMLNFFECDHTVHSTITLWRDVIDSETDFVLFVHWMGEFSNLYC